ncbi:hypothetical protein GW17_00054708 [Ensete ventricosum]|nr:hypothetical protein GW17_00054708 [Ensete ventricosum]
MGGLPTVNRWLSPVICGTGGPTIVWTVYPSTPTGHLPDSVVRAVQPLFTDDLPVEISAKVRSPFTFPASFLIPSANLLANFRQDPTASSELGPMPKLYLGPSSGCSFIDPAIVRPAQC